MSCSASWRSRLNTFARDGQALIECATRIVGRVLSHDCVIVSV